MLNVDDHIGKMFISKGEIEDNFSNAHTYLFNDKLLNLYGRSIPENLCIIIEDLEINLRELKKNPITEKVFELSESLLFVEPYGQAESLSKTLNEYTDFCLIMINKFMKLDKRTFTEYEDFNVYIAGEKK
jgi:hypothetical protein